MKAPFHKSAVLLSGLAILGLAFNSSAAILTLKLNNGSSAGFYDGDIAPNLLTAGQLSLSSVTAPTGEFHTTFPVSGLNDGSAAANGNYTYYPAFTGNLGTDETAMPTTITFNLSGGYDLSMIQVISGWNDSNLGEQNFDLYLRIGSGSFVSYGNYQNLNPEFNNTSPSAYETSLTSDSGFIASNVTGIQFVFMDPGYGINQGGDGGTLIRELQAFGTATTVPEPSAFALLGLAGAGLLTWRRRLVR